MSNTITAYFKGRTGVAESVYQYDYGKVLIIDGLNLPAIFETHFATLGDDDAITCIGQNNRVAIPDACLAVTGVVTAYIYLHDGENDGETEYVVRFAVTQRARPAYEATDEERSDFESAVQQAIAMLQNPKKVNSPLDQYNQVTYGTNGQLLRTKGDGSTEWVDEGLPTDAQTAQAVSDWLDAHPEATTTVQDGSLTEAKFTDALKLKTIKDYVTPEMFGAKGDGVADDSDAINAAINSGFPVLLKNATYLIDENETPTATEKTGIRLYGENATIKLKSQSSISSIKSYNLLSFVQCSDIEISGITFDGNREHLGIEVTDKTNVDLSGILLKDCTKVSIHHNKFVDLIGFGVYSRDIAGGIYTNDNVSNLSICDNYFYKCMNAAKIIEGISENVIFSRNVCMKMDTHGISFYPTATNVIVTDNIIESGIYGSVISEAGSAIRFYETNNVTCTGNIILTAYQSGILGSLRPSDLSPVQPKNINISNNKVLEVINGQGIYVIADEAVITNNIIKDTKYMGIYIVGDNCKVENNTLKNITATGTSCIVIEGDNCDVKNNKIKEAGNFGIHVVSGHSGSIIENNLIDGGSAFSRGIILDSPCQFGNNTIKNASAYNILQGADNVISTNRKLVFYGDVDIATNAPDGTYSVVIDGIADSIVIPEDCTLVSAEAFVNKSLTSGSIRFRSWKDSEVMTYTLDPQITTGKTASATPKRGFTAKTSGNNPYFSKGDVLSVDCVLASSIAPTPLKGKVRLIFECDN